MCHVLLAKEAAVKSCTKSCIVQYRPEPKLGAWLLASCQPQDFMANEPSIIAANIRLCPSLTTDNGSCHHGSADGSVCGAPFGQHGCFFLSCVCGHLFVCVHDSLCTSLHGAAPTKVHNVFTEPLIPEAARVLLCSARWILLQTVCCC